MTDTTSRSAVNGPAQAEEAAPVPSSGIVKFLPHLVLLLSLCVTLYFWRLYDAGLEARAVSIYTEKTEQISRRIIRRMRENEQVLRGAAGLIYSSNNVTRDEWRRYVSALNLGENYPGILGIGFSKWIPAAEKEQHISALRSEGFPEYSIFPDGKRPAYTSIIFLEPFNWRNQRAFGYDMFSEPVRRAAMEKARDGGVAAIAARITLQQETEKDLQAGMLVYVPVYRPGELTDTVERRRRALLGFVYSPIRSEDFVHGTLGKLPDDIAFEIFTDERQLPETLLFSSVKAGNIQIPDRYRPRYVSSRNVEAFGQKWQFAFRTLPPFSEGTGHVASYATLAGGVLVSLLLSMIAFMLLSARNRALCAALELRESEERYRTFFDLGPDGVVILDPESIRPIRFNDQVCRQLGYQREEFAGLRVSDIEAVQSEEEIRARIRSIVSTGRGEFETLQRTRQGQLRNVQVIARYMEIGGKPYYHCIWRDITEQKQALEAIRESDEKFSVAFDNAPVMITISNLEDGRYLDVNQRFTAISGFSREEAIGKTSVELGWVSAADRECLKRGILADGRVESVELNVCTKARKPLLCSYSGEIVTVAGKKRLLSIALDITEHRKVEQQFLQAQKMESVGRLAGGVAHDFNNMLVVILGHAELALMNAEPDSPLRHNLDEILAAANRSADIIRQLLAFARRQEAEVRVLDLNGVVAGMLKMLHRLIGEAVELVWKPGRELWKVKMDPTQVDQVMANLCVNARDAIVSHGKIIIETENVSLDKASFSEHSVLSAGDYVMIAVSDDGSGMEKDVLEHIFEPFYTTKELGQGTGLGLATVFGIVKQNAGFINVYSEPGLGSTFRIYLPAEKKCSEAVAEHAPPVIGGDETILLVEDEPAILNMGNDILSNLGYKVLMANSPEEAIRLAEECRGRFGLLLTDVIMPGMNGRDLANKLQAEYPLIKCMFMSGYTSDIISQHGVLESGAHFIQKPFSMAVLAAKVRETLDGGTAMNATMAVREMRR